MTTAFARATLYNLWHSLWDCADCIEWRCKSGARPALEDKSFLYSLLSMLPTTMIYS
jgi:hypothetical protein